MGLTRRRFEVREQAFSACCQGPPRSPRNGLVREPLPHLRLSVSNRLRCARLRTMKLRTACCALAVLAIGLAAEGVAPIRFEEIAGRSGVRFAIENSAAGHKYQPEAMVAGVAIFDYDGDGFPDLYFVNGGGMPSLRRDGPQFKNRLFHNNGNMTFTDVTDKAGVAGSGYGMGVAIGDYDNDGRPDIFLASLTGNQLFHNNGDGTFTDVTARSGVGGGTFDGRKMWSVSAAWVDYNNDGLLDLFVSNYCQWQPGADPDCRMNGQRFYCSHRTL